MRQRQSVGIDYSARCNATCQHCCVGSSPRATAILEGRQVDEIISDLAQHPDVYEVGITGGEPFLRPKRLYALLEKCQKAGLATTITTNGFWGITLQSAKDVFNKLETLNVKHLTISYDDFHAPFVSVERIRNVLIASKASSISTTLNMCVSKTKTSLDLLNRLGESAFGIKVTRFPVIPCGTGKNIPMEDLYLQPIDNMSLRCPGFEIIYYNDGNVYPCCAPPIFDTGMHLGRIGSTDHEGFTKRVERNELLAAIQRLGLGWFLQQIRELAPESRLANIKEAVSACDVCTQILSNADCIEMLREPIHEALRGSRE